MKKINLRGREMTRSRSEADLRFGPWFGPLEFSKVSPELVISILAPSPTSLNLLLQMCVMPALSQGEGISNTPMAEQAGDGTQPPSP